MNVIMESREQAVERYGDPAEHALRLPYPISVNRYWMPVKIRGHMAMVPSKEAKQYRVDAQWAAKCSGIRKPIPGPVHIHMKLFPRRPDDWAKRARADPDGWAFTVMCMDIDNARKVVYDSLKGIAFEDDKWIRSDSAEIMEPDEYGARVEVTIRPIIKAKIAPELPLCGA